MKFTKILTCIDGWVLQFSVIMMTLKYSICFSRSLIKIENSINWGYTCSRNRTHWTVKFHWYEVLQQAKRLYSETNHISGMPL